MTSRSSSPEPGYRSTAVFPTALMTTARPRPSLKSRQKHCVSFQGAAAGEWGVICWWVIYSSSLWGEGRLSKMLVCCPLITARVSEQAFPFSPRMCLLWPLHSQTRENGSSNYQLDWYVWLSGLRLSVLLWPVVSPHSGLQHHCSPRMGATHGCHLYPAHEIPGFGFKDLDKEKGKGDTLAATEACHNGDPLCVMCVCVCPCVQIPCLKSAEE